MSIHINDVLFIDNLPRLDLHGYDRNSAEFMINEFVNDNYKMRNNLFCIVHGIGSGILKKTTHEVLKKNKKVIEFKTFYYNQGCTLVEIEKK